jgi:hypothetical protein
MPSKEKSKSSSSYSHSPSPSPSPSPSSSSSEETRRIMDERAAFNYIVDSKGNEVVSKDGKPVVFNLPSLSTNF